MDGSTQVVPGLPGSEGGSPPVIVGGKDNYLERSF